MVDDVLALAVGALISVPQASAVGGNCEAKHNEYTRLGPIPNDHQVEARCTSLQADSKAQGTLDVQAAPDLHTAWFTRKSTWYKSGWGATGETIRGPRVDISHL